jgi:hypothetical protein
VISRATGAALIAAGLLSVIAFPLSALVLLPSLEPQPEPSEPVAMPATAIDVPPMR